MRHSLRINIVNGDFLAVGQLNLALSQIRAGFAILGSILRDSVPPFLPEFDEGDHDIVLPDGDFAIVLSYRVIERIYFEHVERIICSFEGHGDAFS